jgi:hypothetical protein
MGNAVHWIDRGAEGFRVYIDIAPRRNGLPNLAAVQAASLLLENFRPDAYDPVEGVSESVARAAQRDLMRVDGVEYVEITDNYPPLPDFGIPILDAGLLPDDDEIVFPRACPVGGCGED